MKVNLHLLRKTLDSSADLKGVLCFNCNVDEDGNNARLEVYTLISASFESEGVIEFIARCEKCKENDIYLAYGRIYSENMKKIKTSLLE